LIQEFEKTLVKKGKMSPQHLRILNNIVTARAEFKKGKLNAHKVDNARKEAGILMNDLIEYSQRCDMVSVDKSRMRIKYKEKGNDKFAELLNFNDESFIFIENLVKKITPTGFKNSDMEEVSKAGEVQKAKPNVEINSKVFEILKKEIGNFEIVF
jgi:hypothetical protein